MQALQRAIWWDDPILFLHRLYYSWEGNSLDIILAADEVQKIEFFPRATLHRLLFDKDKFWWDPRPNTQRTAVHEAIQTERVLSEIAEFEKKVSELIWWREVERVFRMSEFQEKRYRAGKALYILKTLWWIDKKILYTLSIDGWLSHAVLAKSLNKELEWVLSRNPELNIKLDDVKLYPQSISRWFKYNSDKILQEE